MKAAVDALRVVLVAALLSAAGAGCERTASDQASGAGVTSERATGPGSGPTEQAASGASGGSAGTSVSGGADTSGATTSSGTSAGSKSASSTVALLDDSIVNTKVKTALLADAQVKGTNINVETRQGEVMLSGFVKSQSQIDKAVQVASAVEGVKKVHNKMVVKQ